MTSAKRTRPGKPLVSGDCLRNVPDGGEFAIPDGAIVTPLAEEEAQRRNIRLVAKSAVASQVPPAPTSGRRAAHELAALIDHTILAPDATAEQIDKICAEAIQHRFASVCVHGSWIPRVAEILHGSGVPPCAVIGFPHGNATTEAKVHEARRAIADGAKEIDMVIHIGALKGGDDAYVVRDVEEVTRACHQGGAILKAILECGMLTKDEIARASRLCQQAGADFIKTSTGFGGGGAKVEDVALMRRTVGPKMDIKASGGIRDRKTAEAMLAAGATRLGCSSSVAIVTDA
jgi:deoxyribose-phosphate aldolase